MSEGLYRNEEGTVGYIVDEIRNNASNSRNKVQESFMSDFDKKSEETKISHLMGKQFEKLTLEVLKVEKDFQLDEHKIWLWDDYPFKPIGRHRDLGVDIVAFDIRGKRIGIQCKCFRKSADITKSNIDSFLNEIGRREYDRGIIISPNPLSPNAESSLKERDKYCSHVNILKYLDVKLSTGFTTNRVPLPHQEDAIKAVTEGFFEDYNKRGKLIMACGTGKTFTALCIAKKLIERSKDYVNILFVVPSIALIDQARREWLRYYGEDNPLLTLCVCSDNSTGRAVYGSSDIKTSELVGEVTTKPEDVKLFLSSHSDKNKVVFSTYQSLGRVSEAMSNMKDSFSFDMAFSDEAHRTTGFINNENDETDWRLFHNNERLRISKRLYMTATPKVYTEKYIKKALGKREDRDKDFAGMSDRDIYGPTFYSLSLRDAVKLRQLCDYRVIVLVMDQNNSVITDLCKKELNEIQERIFTGKRTRDGIESVDIAKLIGCSLAINGCIEGKSNLEVPNKFWRTLIFANTINKSKWIAEALVNERIRYLISRRAKLGKQKYALEATHMDATTKSNERITGLEKLRNAKDNQCQVITNVRIFSEGVDIPSLDGIIFFEERKSQVDIIQSIGRVLRKAPGKKLGYIILPVFANGEDVLKELEIDKGAYSHIAKVLRALQSHDANFIDCIDDYLHIVGPSKVTEEDKEGLGNFKGSENCNKLEQQELDLNIISVMKTRIVEKTGFSSRKDFISNIMTDAALRIGKKFEKNCLTGQLRKVLKGLQNEAAEQQYG